MSSPVLLIHLGSPTWRGPALPAVHVALHPPVLQRFFLRGCRAAGGGVLAFLHLGHGGSRGLPSWVFGSPSTCQSSTWPWEGSLSGLCTHSRGRIQPISASENETFLFLSLGEVGNGPLSHLFCTSWLWELCPLFPFTGKAGCTPVQTRGSP